MPLLGVDLHGQGTVQGGVQGARDFGEATPRRRGTDRRLLPCRILSLPGARRSAVSVPRNVARKTSIENPMEFLGGADLEVPVGPRIGFSLGRSAGGSNEELARNLEAETGFGNGQSLPSTHNQRVAEARGLQGLSEMGRRDDR